MPCKIASAKLVIPWLFGALGVPATFTGFLVPIREAGVLLPQLAVAAAVRRLAIRKGVWVLAGGLIGLIGDWLGAAATVLVLGLLSLIAAAYSLKLPEVSEPY